MRPITLQYMIFTLMLLLNAGLWGTQQVIASSNFEEKHNKIRIFGDSLVDNGNLPPVTWPFVIPPSTRYDRGRFTNGLVAVERFAKKTRIELVPSIYGINLRNKGINWGIGGSTTGESNINPGGILVDGLLGQIGQYEDALDAAGKPRGETKKKKSPLFIIWTASNNYFTPLYIGESPDGNTVMEAVSDISEAITRLHARGAKVIVVANMTDLGQVPLCNLIGGPEVCDILTDITYAHNEALNIALNTLEAGLSNLKIIQFDIHTLFEKILNNPEKYGFSDADLSNPGPAAGCLFEPSPENCSLLDFRNGKLFWWDELHPSASLHKILGKALIDLVIKKSY